MKNIRLSMFSIVLLLSLIISLCGCNLFKSEEQLIQDRVNAVAEAYNAGDVDALIDCFDSKTRTTAKSALGIGNALIGSLTGVGITVQDVLGLGAGFAGMEYGDSIEIYSIDDIKVMGKRATARVSMAFTDIYSDDKDTEGSELKAQFTKENGDWFIKNISDN